MGKTDVTRNNIVKATMKLAYEKGFDNVTVKSICENAGISKNTFYQYFGNKEEVIGESFSSSDEEKMARLPNILLNLDSPIEQLWEFIKIDIERQMSIGPKLIGKFAVLNVQHDSFYIEDEAHLSSSLTIVLELIKKMQRCNQIKNMSDPFLLLRTACGAIVGIDLRWTKTDGGFDFKKEVYDQLNAIFQPAVDITNY